MNEFTTLNELFAHLISMSYEEYKALDWSSLPLFGGKEPSDTAGVWSWDETRVMVGTCRDDLALVERTEYFA